MRVVLVLAVALMLGVAGCTKESRSPDAIRDRTANVTASLVRNTTAVAKGVFDGLRRKGPTNINTAPREELLQLPGLTARPVDSIIAHRPYARGSDLYRRKVISKKQYNKIASKILAR